jgi:hypothetical protein
MRFSDRSSTSGWSRAHQRTNRGVTDTGASQTQGRHAHTSEPTGASQHPQRQGQACPRRGRMQQLHTLDTFGEERERGSPLSMTTAHFVCMWGCHGERTRMYAHARGYVRGTEHACVRLYACMRVPICACNRECRWAERGGAQKRRKRSMSPTSSPASISESREEKASKNRSPRPKLFMLMVRSGTQQEQCSSSEIQRYRHTAMAAGAARVQRARHGTGAHQRPQALSVRVSVSP